MPIKCCHVFRCTNWLKIPVTSSKCFLCFYISIFPVNCSRIHYTIRIIDVIKPQNMPNFMSHNICSIFFRIRLPHSITATTISQSNFNKPTAKCISHMFHTKFFHPRNSKVCLLPCSNFNKLKIIISIFPSSS